MNCCSVDGAMVWLPGVIAIETRVGGGGVELFPEPPPAHPKAAVKVASAVTIRTLRVENNVEEFIAQTAGAREEPKLGA